MKEKLTESGSATQTDSTFSLLSGESVAVHFSGASSEVLLSGYEGMKAREDRMPPTAKTRLTEALERLVWLYET